MRLAREFSSRLQKISQITMIGSLGTHGTNILRLSLNKLCNTSDVSFSIRASRYDRNIRIGGLY